MKLTLILLFALGFYSIAFSQTQFDSNSIGSIFYQLDNPASLDTFPLFPNELQEQAVLKSAESNRLLQDSTVLESWSNTIYGPTYYKTVDIYKYESNGALYRKLLQTYKYIFYEIESIKDEITRIDYSEDGNSKVNILYRWDNNSKIWKDSIKEEEIYNEEHTERLNIKSRWDSDKGDWVGIEKNEYHLYNRYQVNYSITYIWENESNNWLYNRRIENIIDSLGRTIENKIFKWSNDHNCWNNYIKQEFIYESDTIKLQIDYRNDIYINPFDTINWTPQNKATIIYYPNGRVKQTSSSRWDFYLNDWRIPSIYRYEYDFDSIGHIILDVNYMWDYDINDWQNDEKQEYEYDASGNQVSEKSYYWPEDSTSWFLIRETKSTFDSDNNPILYLSSQYSLYGGDVYKQKVIYNYNQYGYTEQILAFWWEEDINDWELDNRYTYYYSEYITDTARTMNDTILLTFPNPTNDILYFNLNEDYNSEIAFEISDINGNKMQSGTIQQNSISTAGFENGMYFYHLTAGEKSYTGKFVVQH